MSDGDICKYGKYDKSMTRKIICTYYHELCGFQHMCASCGHSKMLVGRYESCRDRVGEILDGRNN